MNYDNLVKYYNKFNEDKRLDSRHGYVEYVVSMKYIREFLDSRDNPMVIDVGAGCGKYSVSLVEMGYDVTAVELVKHNLRVIEKKSDKVKTFLGNALDLSRFRENSYDLVILFGPMYHLISKDDKVKALREARRLVKDDGVIMVAYYMNDYAVIKHGFMDRNVMDEIGEGNLDNDFHVVSKDDDLYSMVRIDEVDLYNELADLERVKIFSPDGPSDYIRSYLNKLDDDEFDKYIQYVISISQRMDLIGASSHIVDIVRKK